MVGDLIPVEVQQFLLKRIDSIAQLEALLLLSRQPEAPWTVAAIAQRLYVSEQEVAALLAQLQDEGLIALQAGEPQKYRYQPSSDELDQLAKQVIDSYVKHLVPVTNLVHAKARSRIQQFADAFKFRKDE